MCGYACGNTSTQNVAFWVNQVVALVDAFPSRNHAGLIFPVNGGICEVNGPFTSIARSLNPATFKPLGSNSEPLMLAMTRPESTYIFRDSWPRRNISLVQPVKGLRQPFSLRPAPPQPVSRKCRSSRQKSSALGLLRIAGRPLISLTRPFGPLGLVPGLKRPSGLHGAGLGENSSFPALTVPAAGLISQRGAH